MTIEIRADAFDPYRELQDFERRLSGSTGKYGATAIFIGTMRDFNEADAVRAMTLEHYPGMTEKHLTRIAEEARERWQLLEVLIVHRVGPLLPNDPIVLVAAWAAHRGPALEACRYLIEELKTRAPFWKKEERPQADARWVERNTPAAKLSR